jgi:hypothetical protein
MLNFAAAGLTILLYDQLLTFPSEVELFWHSKPSFLKYGFLANRYLVPCMMIAVALGGCHLLFIRQPSTNGKISDSSGLVTFSDVVSL